jgi:hypothetical protein
VGRGTSYPPKLRKRAIWIVAEVATALAALTGEPRPLAIKDPGTSPAGEYGH